MSMRPVRTQAGMRTESTLKGELPGQTACAAAPAMAVSAGNETAKSPAGIAGDVSGHSKRWREEKGRPIKELRCWLGAPICGCFYSLEHGGQGQVCQTRTRG